MSNDLKILLMNYQKNFNKISSAAQQFGKY